MQTFYYTFNMNENHPYKNGWISITADSKEEANNIFNMLYPPNRDNMTMNCMAVYDEENFKKTGMYQCNSNLGHGCHRTIKLTKSKKLAQTYDKTVVKLEIKDLLDEPRPILTIDPTKPVIFG